MKMQMESEAREILLSILRVGILRIRMFGWNGSADMCAIEADHIHNLPDLLRNMKPELLRHYYDLSRPEFIRASSNTETFEADWKRLAALLSNIDSER